MPLRRVAVRAAGLRAGRIRGAGGQWLLVGPALLLAATSLGLSWTTSASAAPLWWQVGVLTQGLAWFGVAVAAGRLRGAPALFAATATCLLVGWILLALGIPQQRLADLVWLALAVLLPVALSDFPRPPAGGPPARATAVLLVVLGVAGLVLPGLTGGALPTGHLRGGLACAQVVVLVAALWWRGEHGDAEDRVALLWPALGVTAAALVAGHLVFITAWSGSPPDLLLATVALVVLLVPASVAVGLRAPRCADVRRLISRFAVAVVMVDLTIGVVVGSLAAVTWVSGRPAGKGAVAVIATASAAAYAPVLTRVRRMVEEVLFGGSADPLEAMSRLGAELGTDSSPDAWVAALRAALVVPRVELRVGEEVLAAAGPAGGATETTALRASGEHIGDLVVSRPLEAVRLPPSTRAVLALVAAPLARALQAVRLAEQLRASRGRVVQAREEERRRLRRDLHDGLGPVLTGVAYTADAATNTLRSDTDGAARLLEQLRGDTADAIHEVRRIVQGLRPPALDEVGLAAALRQHAVRYAGVADVRVRCRLPAADGPGRLPAAAEVVAYRVAVEALTNAARHARPEPAGALLHVVIDIEPGEAPPSGAERPGSTADLVVTVEDNGRSGETWTTGTGLASMAARCDEVGGSVVAAPGRTGGRVQLRLPLDQP